MNCMCSTHGASIAATPMQILKDEHRVIEKVLDAMERQLDRPVDCVFYEQALDFLRHFADGCHHAKEEDQLFPRLESAGIPREGGPIGCMLHEHEQGRAFIGIIAENLQEAAAGDAKAVRAVRDAGAGYIALLRQHILKEDNVLFAIADRALGPREMQSMREAFSRADDSNGCSSRHQHYVRLADDLWNRAMTAV